MSSHQHRQRDINLWLSQVSLSGRKSCPTCKNKLSQDGKIYAWYEYIRGKKHLITYFCKTCFENEVLESVRETLFRWDLFRWEGKRVGSVNIALPFGTPKPEWLVIPSVLRAEEYE